MRAEHSHRVPERQEPYHVHETRIVERRASVGSIIAVILAAAVVALAFWFFFLAGDDTRDTLVPDDVDVTLQIDVSENS